MDDQKKELILWLAEQVSNRAGDPRTPWYFQVPSGPVCASAKPFAKSDYGPDICRCCSVNWGTGSGTCADYVPVGQLLTKYMIEATNGGVPTIPWLRAFESELRRWANDHENSSLSGLRDPKLVTAVSLSSTIAEGRRFLDRVVRGLLDGRLGKRTVNCPCCDRRVQAQKRSMNAYYVGVLAWVYRYAEKYKKDSLDDFVNVHEVARRIATGKLQDAELKEGVDSFSSGEWTGLKLWDLIEERGDGKAGWRVTKLGVEFLCNRASVPAEISSYRGEVLRVSKEVVYIENVKGAKPTRGRWVRGA
jgi:hypothetical protein